MQKRVKRLILLFVLMVVLCLLASCRNEPLLQAVSPSKVVCPVTAVPDKPFIPPTPWPALPPVPYRFWYGELGLWTALPVSGEWSQLARGEKFVLWSEEFDVYEDETPDFVVTARRLDGKATDFRSDRTTNAYHEDWHWAMMTGVELSTPGCWQIDARYKGYQLQFVVQVPD